ncbi:MAG TPA: hypothetical protein VGC42_12285 [Kofleriaceae bacterium]
MDPVDRRNFTITGRMSVVTDSIEAAEGVQIVVTHAFGPCGHNLVGLSDEQFDGHPAVTLGIHAGDNDGLIHLSPIHGDGRKSRSFAITAGTRCELSCGACRQPLDIAGDVGDGSGARYYALYLSPQLSKGSMLMVSDLWGHHHSRIIDDFELISYWSARND